MLIVVESPYRESAQRTRATHAAWVRALCRAISLAGDEPVASHLSGPLFLSEDVPEEREHGLRLQRAYLKRADAVWVWDLWGISGGMKMAIDFVTEINVALAKRGLPIIPILYASKGQCPAWANLMEVEP